MNIEPCNVNRNSLRGIKINRIMRRTINNQLTIDFNNYFSNPSFRNYSVAEISKQAFKLLKNNCALSFGPNLF
jgi:hypothetical protein